MEMPFGKHKGEDLRDVPLVYLKWLEEQEWLKDEMREEVNWEIERRVGDRPGQGKVVSK